MNFNTLQKKIIMARDEKILCLSSAASGKALPNSTVIPTPNGPKKVEEIKVGDYLFDRYGNPTKVLGVYPQGKKEVFEITFGDKRTARCCEEHIWYVHKTSWTNKNRFEEITTKQMMDAGLIDSHRGARFSIPVAKAVQYEEKQYDVHPYVIGAFLGDGSCRENRLAFSSADEIMVKHISELLNICYTKRSKNNFTWDFYTKDNNKVYTKDVLPKELIDYSYNKSIPPEYKYGSVEQRLELIRGLMDTDGSITKDKRTDHAATANVTFTSTSLKLIRDVFEVLGSLGYIATIYEDKRDKKYTTGHCYELHINIPNEEKEKLFWLPRKKEIALSVKDKPLKKNYSITTVRNIKSLGYEEEMTCFYVDNEEHVFLTENFITTHNTRVLTERIRHLVEDDKVAPEDVVAITFTRMAADEMKKRLGEVSTNMFIGTIHSYANKICSMNNFDTQSFINSKQFDKIITQALKISDMKYPKIQHLLIDECQDLSELEFTFLNKIPTKNIFFVGDTRQCQPAGTKVKLRNNIVKNIEDVKIGDSVVWYDNAKSYVSGINISYNSIEKKVTKTAVREFVNDNLITIITEKGKQTKYTPNHIGFVKIHQCEYNHAVYLMCDENYRFRIGKIPFTCTNKSITNPWRDKMYKEGCTKIWILDVFKTDYEARLLETKLSYKYQIPQTCWQTDKVLWTKEDIDYIYEDLDTFTTAKECLKEFHRDIKYPLIDRDLEESNHIHFARNAVTQIYACNMMPKVMDVIAYNAEAKHKKEYEQIVQIEYEYITEPIKVYSLEVEGETYVADEIITHNCIYSFRGSSDEFLIGMYDDPAFKKYYLTDNYRNAPNIITFAEDFLRSSRPIGPNSTPVKKKNGIVEECGFVDALQDLKSVGNWGSWFILTRTNAELEEVQERLNDEGIPNVTFKKGDLDILELETLMASDKVKVLTIHSSKGMERKNVIVIGAKTYNEEERRIAYVAATRAENALYWCPTVCKRFAKRKKKTNLFNNSSVKMIEF